MKKKLILIFMLSAINLDTFSQKIKADDQKVLITGTCINFLNWYKLNADKLQSDPITKGFNTDYNVKKDSIVRIDMHAVDAYLNNFKQGGYVTDAFINHLRTVYQNVSDTLSLHPLKDYFGPVPYLEADLLFGFDVDDILAQTKDAKVVSYLRIYDKALLSIKLNYTTELVFSLTRQSNKWQIDYVGFNGENKYNIGSQ
ncbi:hypothetical protein [Mucilaginibacter segetis]|uniref:DUF3828 domain-containing protein n=1 Tax=Mucilaginibacter segetis TaxID=2793071 RepID=A0A934PRU9_9SPHI|nr:hypothetical protein [Mucilaginibacter segetis]MBK0377885.1 hypothetical protein [Mucilaginibacter segetis]